jgi:hypothetical protein
MRRARGPRKARAPRTPGTYASTVGGVGGGELGQAAEEIAKGARELAGWSKQISGDIHVDANETTATIWTEAGPAYPAETRARHPLFGNRAYWFGPPGQRFLAPAAEERAGPALAKYAGKIDRLCREAGFK